MLSGTPGRSSRLPPSLPLFPERLYNLQIKCQPLSIICQKKNKNPFRFPCSSGLISLLSVFHFIMSYFTFHNTLIRLGHSHVWGNSTFIYYPAMFQIDFSHGRLAAATSFTLTYFRGSVSGFSHSPDTDPSAVGNLSPRQQSGVKSAEFA